MCIQRIIYQKHPYLLLLVVPLLTNFQKSSRMQGFVQFQKVEMNAILVVKEQLLDYFYNLK